MAAGGLATTFNFRITLNRSDGSTPPLGDGGFQECTGLEVEMDVAEYVEGGRNNGVVQRAGRSKVSRITLRRYDGTIEVLAPDGGAAVATWAFSRGLPAKVVGPQLNAKTGELAIEELQIAHERLRLVVR